jgi:hypothetical protein
MSTDNSILDRVVLTHLFTNSLETVQMHPRVDVPIDPFHRRYIRELSYHMGVTEVWLLDHLLQEALRCAVRGFSSMDSKPEDSTQVFYKECHETVQEVYGYEFHTCPQNK